MRRLFVIRCQTCRNETMETRKPANRARCTKCGIEGNMHVVGRVNNLGRNPNWPGAGDLFD